MTNLPPDPWHHPDVLWDTIERGALLVEVLLAMDAQRAAYAVQASLSRDDLVAVVLHDLLGRHLPDWQAEAERARARA